MSRFLFCIFLYSSVGVALGITAQSTLVPTPISCECKNHNLPDIVSPLIPAVVNIYTTHYPKQNRSQKGQGNHPFDKLFREFFENFDAPNSPFNFEEGYTDPKSTSLGSGFIIDSTGYIVTNHHVISDADEINVKLHDDTEIPAKVIGKDKRTDLALLKVEYSKSLPHVKFGNSSKLRVGESVFAIGNPFGLSCTVTSGIVSSQSRDLHMRDQDIVDDYVQIDAAINRGNSGGPTFNMNGEVVAINTAIYSPSGGSVGIGFAIPSNTAKKIIEQLRDKGEVTHGFLSIVIQQVTKEIADGLGMSEPTGTLVVDVSPEGDGAKIGLKPGDVILEFNGVVIKNLRKLQITVAETIPGKNVTVLVFRNGKNQTLHGKISHNSTANSAKLSVSNGTLEKNGITLQVITDAIKQEYGVPQGTKGLLVTKVQPNSKWRGLLREDVIIAINQKPTHDVKDFIAEHDAAQKSGKKHVVLLVKRRNANMMIALPIL